MIYTAAINKQYRQINDLVNKISKETGVEKSVVIHFLSTDLERIFNNKIQIHTLSLKNLDTNFNELLVKEQQLIQAIDKKKSDIKDAKGRILKLNEDYENKLNQLEELQIQLIELRSKFKNISSSLSELEKDKKHVEYKTMMKSHHLKEKSDFQSIKIGWILSVFTLIAIIIATLLILNK